MEDLDALLADLQNSAGGSFAPSKPVNVTKPPPQDEPDGLSETPPPPVPPPPTSYSPSANRNDSRPRHKTSVDEKRAQYNSNLSELDSLLDDLSGGKRQIVNQPAPVVKPKPINYDPSQPRTTTLTTRVEALLDELDSTVATSNGANVKPSHAKQQQHPSQPPQPQQHQAPPVARSPPADQMQPRKASNATRELDELMASLSDFKVNVKRDPGDTQQSLPHVQESRKSTDSRSSDSTDGSRRDSDAQHEHPNGDDYAKVDKRAPPPTQPKPQVARMSQLDSMLGNLQTDMSRQGVSTVSKGMCAACNKPIIGQVCTALDTTWHPEHFTCVVCETVLGTKTFFERDGTPYCERDYHERFSPKCAACNKAILDSCVTAMDRTWHPEHFVCHKCHKSFGETGFHEMDGKPYCRDDYYNMFAPKCNGCNNPIMDNYISALNGHWHPQCFVCMECHQSFQGASFFEHEGMPYCEMHYHARRGSLCYSCQKPITGRCITAMHRKFHPEHFICAFCLKQLNKGTFKEQNDKPYCHPCFTKLFG